MQSTTHAYEQAALISKHLEIEPRIAKNFITSARCSCFKQAARSLDMSVTVLRNQLKKLEAAIGVPLFVYKGRTLCLTEAGLALRKFIIDKFGDFREDEVNAQTIVRLASPDSLLNDMLARSLISYIREHSTVRLELSQLNGLPTLPADVMVWMSDSDAPRPSPDFAMTKPLRLGNIKYCAHVGDRYSRGGRLPYSENDLQDYMLAQCSLNNGTHAFEPWNKLVKQRRSSVTEVHSQELVRELVKCSPCIGLLPEYTSRIDKALVPLSDLFGIEMTRIAWLSTTPLAAKRTNVQAVTELIIETFKEREDWFQSLKTRAKVTTTAK